MQVVIQGEIAFPAQDVRDQHLLGRRVGQLGELKDVGVCCVPERPLHDSDGRVVKEGHGFDAQRPRVFFTDGAAFLQCMLVVGQDGRGLVQKRDAGRREIERAVPAEKLRSNAFLEGRYMLAQRRFRNVQLVRRLSVIQQVGQHAVLAQDIQVHGFPQRKQTASIRKRCKRYYTILSW